MMAWHPPGQAYHRRMNRSAMAVAFSALFLAGCGKKEEASKPPTTPPAASGNPVTAPVDYLGAVSKAKKLAEKQIDTAALTQHIQLFHAQEGRFPKDLNELVTKGYLSALPKPPYQMKFNYNAQTGEFKVVPQ
jgi:hypothetical protein